VITPLRLENSEVRLLVNRGWIAIGEDRDRLPAIDTPGGLQQITGVATVPAEKYFTLAKPEPGWQRVWQNMEMTRYAAAVPFPVQPVVVLLDPDSAAGGFTRDWSRLDAGISVHQGYAFQWFMLAAALASIYLFMSLRRRGAGAPKQE
jgi:surfeit locus 1 family protein